MQRIIDDTKAKNEAVQIEIVSQTKTAVVKTKLNKTLFRIEFKLPDNISRNQAIQYIEEQLESNSFKNAVNVSLEQSKHEIAISEISESLELAN